MPNLFTLFDERQRRPGDLIANSPQTLESLSTKVEEQEFVLRKIRTFEEARPKVDFSNFANFVFFNSALDYFNLTGEKLLNEYPYDGTRETVQIFLDEALDDYQRFVVST